MNACSSKDYVNNHWNTNLNKELLKLSNLVTKKASNYLKFSTNLLKVNSKIRIKPNHRREKGPPRILNFNEVLKLEYVYHLKLNKSSTKLSEN